MTTSTDDGRFSYQGLDRVLHEKARLGILSSLVAHKDGLKFGELRALCQLTDGNLPLPVTRVVPVDEVAAVGFKAVHGGRVSDDDEDVVGAVDGLACAGVEAGEAFLRRAVPVERPACPHGVFVDLDRAGLVAEHHAADSAVADRKRLGPPRRWRWTPGRPPSASAEERRGVSSEMEREAARVRIEELERTKGGIVLPDTAKEKPQEGEVIAVGQGKRADDGKLIPLDVKPGDRILFGKYSGSDIKIDGEEYMIMREDEVLGVLDNSKKK